MADITRHHTGPRMSQSVVHNGIAYLAGQVGTADATVAQQTQDCLDKVDNLLAEVGSDKTRILTVQIWMADMADFSAGELVHLGRKLRDALNAKYEFIHPEHAAICGLSHILWTGAARDRSAHGRNAVLYGEKAIDRSPCGTGTSSRMAQLVAKGKLAVGDDYIHESIIGSLFKGRVESATTVAGKPAIIPSIAGWARVTGINTIFIDDRDPFAHGFVVK